MKRNKMFYVIIVIVLAMLSFMVWFLFYPSSASKPSTEQTDILDIYLKDLSPEELRAMGIEGDTKNDTVRTLIGTAKANNKKFDEVIAQNEKLIKENERLKNQQNDIDYQIQQAVQAETGFLINQMKELKDEMLSSANNITNTNNHAEPPKEMPINGANTASVDANGISWVSPSDLQAFDDRGNLIPLDAKTRSSKLGFPKKFSQQDQEGKNQKKGLPFINNSNESSTNDSSGRKNPNVTPYFTIAPNSTLTNSISMTALVGRVPIDNNVTEPYPFKLLVGRENLIANGIDLPDIEGAIVSGTATGDWTLSCVRGNVTSLTFVFSDGRIVTSGKNSKTLGWLSDPHGIPCIPGTRKTNAPEYLGTNFLLAGASAAAQGLSQAQTTTVVEDGSVIGAVTGNNGKFILGQALGSGLKETTDWFRQRYGQTFDAIYVPPGQELAVHIDEEIQIDYSTTQRKVKYARSSHHTKLD